jgi:threonine dehydratase
MFPLARDYVDRVVLVEDAAIASAQRTMWDALRVVAEPGWCRAMSALCPARISQRATSASPSSSAGGIRPRCGSSMTRGLVATFTPPRACRQP